MALERILLVRHDLTSAVSGFIQGQTDTQLLQGFRTRVDGLTDLIASEEEPTLKSGVPIHVISSSLGRTYGTAERMTHRLWDKYHYQTNLLYSEDLKERGQGDLEGKSFKEALTLLSADPNLPPTAESVYPLLYLRNDIPNGETHEALTARLQKVVSDYIQQLTGIGILAVHEISGMNCLKNLLTDGNILGNPPRPYQHFLNLSVVRLEPDPASFMRYKETGRYGPQNHSEANVVLAK